MNGNISSFCKENQIYPRLMTRQNFNPSMQGKAEIRKINQQPVQDPKISLLKVSEDYKKDNRWQHPSKPKIKDESQSSKKLRKLGLKVIANS